MGAGRSVPEIHKKGNFRGAPQRELDFMNALILGAVPLHARRRNGGRQSGAAH